MTERSGASAPWERPGDEPPLDVLWLCLPWQAVSRANLGLALISALTRDSARVGTRYSNIDFARRIGPGLYQRLQASRLTAEGLFVPAAFDLRDSVREDWASRAFPLMQQETGLEAEQAEHVIGVEVPRFLDAMVDEIVRRRPAIVGFSLLVSQTVPALAVARRLRAVLPEVRVLVGGSACAGPMGAALLRNFRDFDVAVTGEIGLSITSLVRKMLAREDLSDVPGVAYREDGVVRSNAPASLDALETLPPPDYSDFVSQFRASGLDEALWLPFESSRGCWWGERVICSFCGLNGENVIYRRKPAARVAEELLLLSDRHGVDQFCATDNILPADADKELLPALARVRERVPGLRIYYQMKSNFSRALLDRLVAGGVTMVQPGIESFDDSILRLMRKGATGLSQVRAIKLTTEAGVEAIYGILHGTVGETADNLRDQTELLPALHHLQPPSYYSPISLDRFSPYAEESERFGIELLPSEYSELLYPDPDVDRMGITGVFQTRRQVTDPELEAAVDELGRAVVDWQQSHDRSTCDYAMLPGPIVQVREGRDGNDETIRLDGALAEVLALTDEVTSLRAVARQAGRPFEEVSAAADELHAARLIVRRRDRAVALPLRRRRGAIIGLAGLPCAGKSTLVGIAREMGIACFDVGESIRRKFGTEAYELSPADKIRLLGKSDSVFRSLGPELREAFVPGEVLLVDSFKAVADLAVVREEVPEAMVESWHVTADEGLRGARFVTRARPDDGPSLTAKEEKLRAIDIDGAVQASAWTIVNDGSREELATRGREFLTSVLAALHWNAG
ncbi:RiPP maturation radical SAM C-methyltransferase [Actinoplanes couchii]|uniref:RiPP maturation radical SAM protein 1 n=1 Tax=Actinoplanes couchii TaxID=403638 RepID=A0ABQ3XSD4_9ACTN|nr:RiPP maturation radical SAM C-methyltransferase [Actinoplanes couchii]MDR6315938.1 ribosomal peptide maturation radical SAM protein 1 [Actinoplanes couchii]GID61412.1 RiPP maturation radical SAM protein 1 [Actinoplanes couchii]